MIKKLEKNRNKRNVIILGSGIVGLFAYKLLKRKYNVKIIEHGNNIGGLYSSEKIKNNFYDFGTHIPFLTGNNYIDKILFKNINKNKYNIIDRSIKEGLYFKKKLDLHSGTLDFRLFNKKVLKKAQKEILINKKNKKFKNLYEKINYNYGKSVRIHLYEPVLKKLINFSNLKEIYPEFLEDFSISRIRIFEDNVVKKLKKNDYFDNIISFNKITDGNSKVRKFYPKIGGSINWINNFFNFKKNKKNIFLNTSIKQLIFNKNKIKKIITSNNRNLDCDYIIWTAPPIFFLNLVGKKIKSTKPKFINLILTHLEIDKKPNHNLEYLSCYEKNFKTFRVTFYSNLRGSPNKKPYNLTVEALSTRNENLNNQYINKIFFELKKMNIIHEKSKILHSKVQLKKNIVAIQSPKSLNNFKSQLNLIKRNFNNVILAGKNSVSYGFAQNLIHMYKECIKL